MNGQRKYKVTIRVVDHPPSTRTRFQNSNSALKNEQKADILSVDNTVSSGINSVYKSSVSEPISERQDYSRVHDSDTCVSPRGHEIRSTNGKAEPSNRIFRKEGMLNSEFCECNKPLLGAGRTASLNINKLTRNNAIDQEDLEETRVDINNIGSCDFSETANDITTGKQSPKGYSRTVIQGNYGIRSPKNGFPRQLPIVVLNSGNMEGASHEQNILTNNAIGNGICDDFLPDCLDTLGTSTDRPPLNREGSACSSDSIITEIEGLSDDEEDELKGYSNECGNSEQVCLFLLYFCQQSRESRQILAGVFRSNCRSYKEFHFQFVSHS